MTKATQTVGLLTILLAFWLALYTGVISTSAKFQSEIVPVLPWWGLVSFGAYALGTLGFDVLTFNDKPEKYAELMKQIATARADLKAKGVSISA